MAVQTLPKTNEIRISEEGACVFILIYIYDDNVQP